MRKVLDCVFIAWLSAWRHSASCCQNMVVEIEVAVEAGCARGAHAPLAPFTTTAVTGYLVLPVTSSTIPRLACRAWALANLAVLNTPRTLNIHSSPWTLCRPIPYIRRPTRSQMIFALHHHRTQPRGLLSLSSPRNAHRTGYCPERTSSVAGTNRFMFLTSHLRVSRGYRNHARALGRR
jgi:hypothetical protein